MDEKPALAGSSLQSGKNLTQQLDYIYNVLAERFPGLSRVAVALHDARTGLLRTFSQSGRQATLVHYQFPLAESASLQAMAEGGEPRIVDDLSLLANSGHAHTAQLLAQGFRSSYTRPIWSGARFLGFVFFNADGPEFFRPQVVHHVDDYGHLISLLVANELQAANTLSAVIKTARDFTHHRDVETAAHLDRISSYARLIAVEIADTAGLSDEFIELIYRFTPLHDIGKIAIPDQVLLKEGPLDAGEYELMKQHVHKGREIVETLIADFGLQRLPGVDVLQNIAAYHHEAMDGSGYPDGLSGEAIPIEARITAVADVFDALTSPRPYKSAWDNEAACATLQRMSGGKLDPGCVQALLNVPGEIARIQREHSANQFG